MPFYRWECEQCDHQFETMHRMVDAPQTHACPECGGKGLRVFGSLRSSTMGDDLTRRNDGKPQYCPGLARRMPYNRDDPQAFFTSKYAAREAARRKADTGDYQLTFD